MSEVPMQILRRLADPLITNKPIARARRPIGKSTIQHSATPNATTPDESPQIGGKAVDPTTTTPQSTAGNANTSAATWNRIPMALGLFPVGGAKIGSGPFSIISHAFLPANKITVEKVIVHPSAMADIVSAVDTENELYKRIFMSPAVAPRHPSVQDYSIILFLHFRARFASPVNAASLAVPSGVICA